MKVSALTFAAYHGKNAGSTRLRIEQLLPHWPEFELYKYGSNPDAMIFQKIYILPDWKFIEHYQGIKILDMCDPDWLEGSEVKRTIDAVDGVTVATDALAEFVRQLTDKPVLVLPDRHELANFALTRQHTGPLESVVWFGYKHNAEVALKYNMNFLTRNGVRLTVMSNEDPHAYNWAEDAVAAEKLYRYKKFDEETLNTDLVQFDAAFLPTGNRPKDRFKSNNRTIIAQLCGLPLLTDAETFLRYSDPANRQTDSEANLALAKRDYDIRLSVKELKSFLEELRNGKD